MGRWCAEAHCDQMELDGALLGMQIGRHELAELAVDECNSAVYVTDASAQIVFINRTFTDILGWQPQEVYGSRARSCQEN